jgi:hypothetical protein
VSPVPSWVLSLVPDWGREWRYRRRLCSEAYRRGYRDAWSAGRRALLEELAADQRRACGPAALLLDVPEYAELEQRRWPGGRDQAGQPRPGDYEGGPVTW